MTDEPASSAPEAPHHSQLKALRHSLLHLHKSLMESERTAYEAVFGKVTSNQRFLELLLKDPWFAWLHAISELIVLIDEAMEAEDPPLSPADSAKLTEQVRTLLKTSETGVGFEKQYFDALQRDPDVVLAHAEVARLLKAKK